MWRKTDRVSEKDCVGQKSTWFASCALSFLIWQCMCLSVYYNIYIFFKYHLIYFIYLLAENLTGGKSCKTAWCNCMLCLSNNPNKFNSKRRSREEKKRKKENSQNRDGHKVKYTQFSKNKKDSPLKVNSSSNGQHSSWSLQDHWLHGRSGATVILYSNSIFNSTLSSWGTPRTTLGSRICRVWFPKVC